MADSDTHRPVSAEPRRSFAWGAPILITAILLGAFFLASTLDEQQGKASLDLATSLLVGASKVGGEFVRAPWELFRVSVSVLGGLLSFFLLLAVLRWRERASARAVLLLLAFGCAFQICLLYDRFLYAWLCLGALVLFGFLWGMGGRLPVIQVPTGEGRRWSIPVLGAFSLVLSSALLLRCYALNLLPNLFEGELSPYYLGALTIKGMFEASSGLKGPWAPLGLLYYLPISVCFKLFGISLLSVRLASVLTSVLTISLLFIFVRGIAGTAAGLAASAMMAVDNLQIGWGRTDIHPHGSTTWPTLLLCMALVRTLDAPSLRSGTLLALSIALTWHQYPSGQFAVFIPWIVLLLSFFWVREQRPRKIYWAAIIVGSFLWAAGGVVVDSIGIGTFYLRDYVHSLGERVYANRLEEQHVVAGVPTAMLEQAWQYSSDLLQGIFYKPPYLFHQDILKDIIGFPLRTLEWPIAAFALVTVVVLALQPRRKEHAIMLAWIVAAILPAAFSDRGYPKRASTLYPALMACAGIAFGWTWTACRQIAPRLSRLVIAPVVAGSFVGAFAIMSHLWFSTERNPYGRPIEERLVKKLLEEFEPGTRMIVYVEDNYEIGKFAFLMLPNLIDPSREPRLWLVNRFIPEYWQRMLRCPSAMSHELSSEPFYYVWPQLLPQLSRGLQTKSWKKTMYVVHLERDGLVRLEELKAAYPNAGVTYVPEDPAQAPGHAYAYVVLETALDLDAGCDR